MKQPIDLSGMYFGIIGMSIMALSLVGLLLLFTRSSRRMRANIEAKHIYYTKRLDEHEVILKTGFKNLTDTLKKLFK